MEQPNTTSEKRRPKWIRAFLAHLALTGNVRASCLAAKIDRADCYKLRNSDQAFAAEWTEALDSAADLLEEEARRRAYAGVQKPVIYQGELMGMWVDATGQRVSEGTPGARQIPLTVTEYSDTLLIFLLKGERPAKYRDNIKHEHSGVENAPITIRTISIVAPPVSESPDAVQ